MAAHYPDDLRGPGIGWALAVGRLGAILGPALGGWILAGQLDAQWNFYLFALPGVVGTIAAALMPAICSPRPSEAAPGRRRPSGGAFGGGPSNTAVSLWQELSGSRHMLALWTPSTLQTPGRASSLLRMR
jgi:MFS family permease